jgi:hypothetical protein
MVEYLVNNDLEKTRKEEVFAYAGICLERPMKTSLRRAGVQVEI